MRTIRYAFWALVAVCLITVGLANRGVVTLRAMPETFAGLVGVSPDVQLPLFVVIYLGVGVGLLIGFVWEWLREWRHRSEARGQAREVQALQREVGRLRAGAPGGKDDIMALLDAPSRR